MSTLTNQIISIIYLVMAILVIAGITVFFIIRSAAKKASKHGSAEEPADSSKVKRDDINSYIVFDDIKDGVVVLNNYKRFVSAVEVQGCDLFDFSVSDQTEVQHRYTQLFDMLPDDETMQLRYEPIARDMSYYTNNYKATYESVCETLYQKLESLNHLSQRVAKMQRDKEEDREEYSLYLEKLASTEKEIEMLTSQKNELYELIGYLKEQSGEDEWTDINPDMRSTYVFSWEYRMSGLFEESLTNEQILERAKKELRSMANSYISALADVGLHARQVTTTEKMTDIFRRYFRPKTGGMFKVEDIMQGSVMDYVTDSERDTGDIPKHDGYENARLAEAHSLVMDERKEAETDYE